MENNQNPTSKAQIHESQEVDGPEKIPGISREPKAVFSLHQRFQNVCLRNVVDVSGEAEESRMGPVGGPWEAVAVHSRLASGNAYTIGVSGGCSGVLWTHEGKTWGLTHGSIIAPLLEVETEKSLMDVVEMARKHNSNDEVPKLFGKLELYIQREEYPDFEASVVDVWACSSLAAAFDHLLASGWDFFGDGLLKFILSMLVVFRPLGKAPSGPPEATAALMALLEQVHRGGLIRGSPVLAISSPFTGVSVSEKMSEGSLRRRRLPIHTDGQVDTGRKGLRNRYQRSPFMNSWSQGVVSGICGPGDRSLFLTDARATGGSEGGPVFTRVSGREGEWKLAGMLLRSICYWRGEWVGFSIACYLEPTLKSFLGVSGTTIPSMGSSVESAQKEDKLDVVSMISSFPVVLVMCGYSQGSGIPIKGRRGLILTCAHVVRKHNLGIKVTWLKGKKSVTKNAEVIYLTAPNLVYDIAVISVGPGTSLPTVRISKELPQQGDVVWLVGYAMHFRPNIDTPLEAPLLSRGIISSVVPWKRPSLLQTTCCVQAGSSGGAVVREKDGKLLGVMVCNTAVDDFRPGRSKPNVIIHPSINFAIPAITLSGTLSRFYKTEDPSVLNEFQSPDERVQEIWKLKAPKIERCKL
ncbi:uncharacterized protein [Hetaerina americana]|uniref:uncharacterized protein isoform X2 n=1 Tax=Hetaerina americana TaxID=62018 RepID=UPI003A7F38C8